MSEWINLGQLMVQYGIITSQDLKEGLRYKEESGLRLGEALVKLGKVTMEDIDWILSKQLDIPFVIIDDIIVNTELLVKFSKEYLIDNRILPLYETDKHVSIVIEDPFNMVAIDYIKKTCGKDVSLATGSGSKIEALLKHALNKTGLPELINSIQGIIKKIWGTSFYRLDFILTENECTINVFGFGILKEMEILKGHFLNEDLFRAFDSLGVPFLYEQSFSAKARFVAVYPLENKLNIDRFPAVICRYGLCLPDTPAFTDAHFYGTHQMFPLENPVPGYMRLVTQKGGTEFNKSIYTIDAAPEEFSDFYVDLLIPGKCTSCKAEGCPSCNELGYVFRKIEGVYSSDDLNEELKED